MEYVLSFGESYCPKFFGAFRHSGALVMIPPSLTIAKESSVSAVIQWRERTSEIATADFTGLLN